MGLKGPFARATLGGCFAALRWLLWIVAALAATLLVVQSARGGAEADKAGLVILALGFTIGGWACGKAGAFLARE